MPPVTLIVRMNAKPGKASEVEAALRAAVAPTHTEAGCLRYALLHSTKAPDFFVLVERWASQGDLDAHMKMPYLQTLFAVLKEALAAPAEVESYEMTADGNPAKNL